MPSTLKLIQVATPTSATQVTSTSTPVKQVIISNSGANSTTVGDSTMTTGTTGIVVPSGSTLTIGNPHGAVSFNLTELYVLAATGNVNVLALLF